MTSWPRLAIYASVIWSGALIISFLVTEWRQPDLDPIEKELLAIREVQGSYVPVDVFVPQPYVSPTLPAQREKAKLREGESVDLEGGGSLTVDRIDGNNITFIIEGPYSGAFIGNFLKAVDTEGFLCQVGYSGQTVQGLADGEKTTISFIPDCGDGRKLDWLQVDDMLFEVP